MLHMLRTYMCAQTVYLVALIVHLFVPQIVMMPGTVLGARNIAGNKN